MPKSELKYEYTLIGCNVRKDKVEKVKELAKIAGYDYVSDMVRDALELMADKHGVDLEFDVDRGGDRISGKKSE